MLLFACAVVLLLVVLNGLFAMSELAVVSSRKPKLQARAERGDKGARAALRLAEHPTRFLSSVQVGITLIGILAGAYGQATIAHELDMRFETIPLIAPYSEAAATAIVVVALTYFSLIIGELVPKRLALIFPETIAGVVARPLGVVAIVMAPFITLLTASTAGVLRLLGVRDSHGEAITQEEVETVLAEGASAGLIEPEEQAIISEVLRLGDRPVRVAMTPRRDVHWISLEDDEATIRDEIRASPHSRLVVSREADVDNAVGVVHKKDVLNQLMDGGPLDLEAIVQTPLFLPDSSSVLQALEQLKATTVHMAFVVDEFGNLRGVVTATDLLEMIAGDFNEEHDAEASLILAREDGSFLIDGRTDLADLNTRLGEDYAESDGFHTAAGLVLNRLGRIPEEGETLVCGGFKVEVIDMDGRRIDKLLFTPVRPPPEPVEY